MAAAFSPCGVAMLPSYFALMASKQDRKPWLSGLVSGGAMSLGFVLVFSLAAILLFGVRLRFTSWLPAIGITLGALLVLWGALSLWKPQFLSLFGFGHTGVGFDRRVVLFGVTYGIACLSCALPVFLLLTLQALSAATTEGLAAVLVLYLLGMSLVTTAIAILAVTVRQGFQRWLLASIPRIVRLSSLVVMVSGAYLTLYWLHALGVSLQGVVP